MGPVIPPHLTRNGCFRTRPIGAQATVFSPLKSAGRPRTNVSLTVGSETFRNKKIGGNIQVDFSRVFQPSAETIRALTDLWRNAWSSGIRPELDCFSELRSLMLVDEEQIAAMHSQSWDNIPVAAVDGKITGAIWGQVLDLPANLFPGDKVGNYDLTTQGRTFANRVQRGNSLLCMSVAVNSDYNGFLSEDGLSIGQKLVQTELMTAIQSPYITRVIAYSRPSSLAAFVELITAIKAATDHKIYFDQNRAIWLAERGGDKIPAMILEQGIMIGDKLYTTKASKYFPGETKTVPAWSIEPTRTGFKLAPKAKDGQQPIWLETDIDGIFTRLVGEKKYLVPIKPYLETKYDQMVRFHGGRGGEIIAILPEGRRYSGNQMIGDPIALGYNIIFEFPVGKIILENDLAPKAFSLLDLAQREFVVLALRKPKLVKRALARLSLKDIYRRAFSKEKAAAVLAALDSHREKTLDYLRASDIIQRMHIASVK